MSYYLLVHPQMFFDFTAKEMLTYDSTKSTEDMGKVFCEFVDGFMCFPVKIPGTTYHKCLQVNCKDHEYSFSV